MSWLLMLLGVVATVQGVAWVARAAPERVHRRASVGMLLAPVGLLLLGSGLLGALIPGFWR